MDDANDHLSNDITESAPDEKDQVSIDIMTKLVPVKLVSRTNSDPRIQKVPKLLRDVNAKAYEPQIIAIGPHHCRNKPHLQGMEKHKLLYLKMLLQRTGENDVERYVKKMRELEERTRACYIDAVRLKENRFVEMLLLDACFIVELFRKYHKNTKTMYYDPVFDLDWMQNSLCRDLLLVESQIPFFVLDAFFQMTTTKDERNNFVQISLDFFFDLFRFKCDKHDADHFNIKEINHLLSLVHDRWFRPVVQKSPTRKCEVFKIFCLLRKEDDSQQVERISCATKLKEAGIKFSVAQNKALFDIEFENGTMKIPKLTIEDNTESFFRNLIAYEQLYPKESNPVIDYMNFLDCLIDSAEDVELLCQRDVVANFLGDEEVVAKMFNSLGKSVTLSGRDHYTEIYKKVNKHCGKRRNIWMANLRHKYFNSPWALISFLAAVLLLLISLGQAVLSVLTYITKNDKLFLNV